MKSKSSSSLNISANSSDENTNNINNSDENINININNNNNINNSNNSNNIFSTQFEYLNQLKKNYLLPLKNLCLIHLSKIILEKINNEIIESNQNPYFNSTNNSNQILLEKLPLDLREELIHFMLDNLSSSSSSSSTPVSTSGSFSTPLVLSKSRSTEFIDKSTNLAADSDETSSISSNNSSNSSNNSNTIQNLKKQKRFSLKNKIFSKKKQQQNENINYDSSNQKQMLNEINEDILSNSLYDLVLSPRLFSSDSGLIFLSLRQCSLISDQVIRKLIKLSPNLAYLDLAGCKISQKTLLIITTTCSKLKTLNIGHIDLSLSSSLSQSISKLSGLASLDLCSIPKLTSQLLNLILYSPGEQFIHRGSISAPPTPRDSRNPQNQTLYQQQNNVLLSPRLSSHNQKLHNQSQPQAQNQSQHQLQPISPRGDQPVVKKISLSPSIQSLSSISSASSNLFTPRSQLAFEVSGVFPNTLLSINISHTEIDDVGLIVLAKKCIYLQDLDISYCNKITNQGLSDMSNNIETLVTFSAKVVKASVGLIDLVTVNLNLVKLELQFTKLEESHLKEMSSVLSKLTTLRLDGTPMTDEIFNNFSKKNLHLQIIGLSQCKGITWEIFSILGKNCKGLKKLYLSHCKMSNSPQNLVHLGEFFKECSFLSVLDIAYTPLVKDQVLSTLIRSKCSKSIETLFIGGGFHNLSNEVVRQLVYACPKMKVFSCISCYNIKDDAILLAMDRWLLLEAIELTDCTSLTTLTPNFIGEHSHIHSHLRFIFLSITTNIKDLDEDSILDKIKESSLEIFEMNQEITLENVIEQNWLNI
ncbi:hypothetical protein DICPUDRAFT_149353 [Dictyostelium purpureum]|uniref:RNI-like protein n=1 Tax=Dictyostelium purpureum TaxID=5786 RepID=F0ZDH2_DICPU|nr:uncharacterized protein DICPUDRAFT_149353 [Dictyostelium purpureum]EGC37998.1 hypothetical protein DICPUDRAFT_149353 [Dictyostelium purpureum]|eukprot:XP_003285482.1 hypothetical protein DICPUDRAFT_149353 [Dictyostelium purpureum]